MLPINLDKLSWWLSAALGVACAVLGLMLFSAYASHADTKRQWAEANEAAERARGKEQDRQRAIERERQQLIDAQRSELDATRTEIDAQARQIGDLLAANARLSADLGRVRDQNRRFAAGDPGSDSLSACQARAGALADLLTEGEGLLVEGDGLLREGARLAAEAAGHHDRRSAEVIALTRGWCGEGAH